VAEPLRELCRRGLHPMTGDNVGVQRSTGRQFCKACRRDRRRRARQERAKERAAEPICRKGHALTDDNLHTTAKGNRVCRACLDLANEGRRERRSRAKEIKRIAELAPEAKAERPGFVVPPGGIRSYGVGRGEAAARYRLAQMVRRGRPLSGR
jgi:hypothetical protein